ncbi:FecR domain-containing protein [Pelagibacteraceae bacterium]|nr:FecR domain-containing protein [Pelagibacteraceae bacterium]
MRNILIILFGLLLCTTCLNADQEITIEKQLVGIIGAASGTISTGTRDLKTGDKVYLGETIYAGANSGTQVLLLDQSTFTIGSDSEVVIDTFVYDPSSNVGKIISKVKKGSLKVISGLISLNNPDNLTVTVPAGTIGARGTEFQTIVNNQEKSTKTLLIGPGKNNTLGLRPGSVLVSNIQGNTLLDNPYTFTKMTQGRAPDKAKKITNRQLKEFKKKMKALKNTDGSKEITKKEKKALKKELKASLKTQGLNKDEIKNLLKGNITKDQNKKEKIKEKRAELKKKKQEVKEKKKEAKKKKGDKKKKAVKKKKGDKKKKAVKKKKSEKKKKAVKKKKTKKKKAVKKKKTKKKKAVKKKKTKKKKKIIKKKVQKKKKKAKKKRKLKK